MKFDEIIPWWGKLTGQVPVCHEVTAKEMEQVGNRHFFIYLLDGEEVTSYFKKNQGMMMFTQTRKVHLRCSAKDLSEVQNNMLFVIRNN